MHLFLQLCRIGNAKHALEVFGLSRAAQCVVWRGVNVDRVQQLLIIDCLSLQCLLATCLGDII